MEKKEVIYNKIDEIPEWAQSSIQKAITAGVLRGTGEGRLGLTLTEIKMLVWMDRVRAFDFKD